VLKEQIYRWLGLVVLAAAVAASRSSMSGNYKPPSGVEFPRLGVVLVVLGFIYNKYQEKSRIGFEFGWPHSKIDSQRFLALIGDE